MGLRDSGPAVAWVREVRLSERLSNGSESAGQTRHEGIKLRESIKLEKHEGSVKHPGGKHQRQKTGRRDAVADML